MAFFTRNPFLPAPNAKRRPRRSNGQALGTIGLFLAIFGSIGAGMAHDSAMSGACLVSGIVMFTGGCLIQAIGWRLDDLLDRDEP